MREQSPFNLAKRVFKSETVSSRRRAQRRSARAESSGSAQSERSQSFSENLGGDRGMDNIGPNSFNS